ncbi:MAG: hypothetical protein V3V22_09290 [Methylococcales bacterium]
MGSEDKVSSNGSLGVLSMKNIFLYVLLWAFCFNARATDQVDHRYNPFQFKLTEHYLKAKPILIDSIALLPNNYQTIEFNGYQFYVPESFILSKEDQSTLAILDENKKGLFLITLKPSDALMCNDTDNRKDYCSAFDSRRELFVKSFTLTPKDLSQQQYSSIGHSWIVFDKASMFEDVTDIKMYERDSFIFFRQYSKPPHPMANKTFIFISSPKDDELLDITFLVEDETLIMDAIKSFQLIKQ